MKTVSNSKASTIYTYRLRPLDPMIDHAAAVASQEHLILPANLDVIQRSMQTGAGALEAAVAESEQAQRRDLTVFDTADIVLLPVAGGPACDVSGKLDIDGQSIFGWDIMAQCRAVTMLGAPVVSLPVGLSSEGLPLSVQIVARPGADALALDFAEWLEGFTRCDLPVSPEQVQPRPLLGLGGKC